MQGNATLAIRSRTAKPLNYGRAVHLLREVEKKSGTGGTGATILKMVSKPLGRLIEDKSIGPEELQAASDIFTAFMAITGSMWVGPQSWERRDRAYEGAEAVASIDAQRRYKAWAEHWSMMAKRGDKTLPVIIAAVIDEHPFYQIEDDLHIRNGTARKATIAGLRDYAARAGWVRGQVARQWMLAAPLVFRRGLTAGDKNV